MKRRLLILAVLCMMVVGLFAVPAAADNSAPKVEMYITVNPEGDCLVSMNVNFHTDTADESLTFPLPKKAANITMNGGAVGMVSGNDCVLAQVGKAFKGMSGDFTARFDYTVPNAVKVNDDRKLQFDLDLLCGFMYPVYNVSFVITFPGTISVMPSFNSTYQQISFESNLDLTVKDNMMTGSSKNGLKDHEAVSMTMVLNQSMRELFPTVSTYQREGNPELYPMGALAGLALLYWLIFLRTLPPIRTRSTTPPAGVSAGEMGCRLTMTGGDLSMMILSWAQMGYLLIQLDGNGKVRLHKRMDMGNERNLFEVRIFQTLFGDRKVVDCSGAQFAKTCARTAAMIPGEQTMCKPGSGNRKVVRVLLCIAQIFCGICVAMNMTGIFVLEILFSVLFGVFGIFSAWQMQNIAFCQHVRHKTRMWVGLACALVWVILGVIAHQWLIPLGACLVQIAFSWLIAYGGRRTDLNRSEAGEILGLKRYLKNLPRPEAARLLKADQDYFFRMAPFAIALGVGKPFAAAFVRRKMDPCPYFILRGNDTRTAEQWMNLMIQTVSAMESRYRRMQLEKWMAIRMH